MYRPTRYTSIACILHHNRQRLAIHSRTQNYPRTNLDSECQNRNPVFLGNPVFSCRTEDATVKQHDVVARLGEISEGSIPSWQQQFHGEGTAYQPQTFPHLVCEYEFARVKSAYATLPEAP
jgi:hypothetical protein